MTAEPTLVELFTSEGCSSCPPAEALLRSEAASDPSLLVLEFHVDYWDSLGWKDPYSSPDFSERQERYAAWRASGQVYTPQAIVDGVDAFIGSDSAKLGTAVRRARETDKHSLALELRDGRLEIDGADAPGGDLWVAVTEAGLETRVRRGENEGRLLRHAPLVRSFREVGPHPGGPLARQVTLRLDPAWHRENLRIVAAIQERGSGKVVAVGAMAVVPAH